MFGAAQVRDPFARWGFALGALGCALLLGFAYYLQHVDGQEPCPLCLVQRAFYYAYGALFLAAALQHPARSGRLAYSAAGFALALGGAGTAARQVWLQHLPSDQVPACGPGLEFLLQNLPLLRAVQKVFAGSGECAEVKWRLLGGSIAEWSLAGFVALALLAALLGARALRR